MLRFFLKAATLFVLLLLLIVPILGQDVEPVPTEVPVQPEVEQVVVPPEAVVEPESVRVNLVQVIIGLLGAFAAGGIIGIAGVAVFADRIRNDSPTVTALELLAHSWPPGTRELLLQASRGARSIGALGEEVFDNVPFASKPPEPNSQ